MGVLVIDCSLLLLPLGVALVGDRLLCLPADKPRLLRGCADALQHGLVGLSVCLPLCLAMPAPVYALAVLSSLTVDVDHVWRTPKRWDRFLRRDGNRWIPHHLLFPLVLGAVTLVATRQPRWGWLVCCGAMSHTLRDAALSPSPLLWPGRRVQLPPWVYHAAVVLLAAASVLWTQRHGGFLR